MTRTKAHCEKKEPFLEEFLSNFRFNKINKHIPKNSIILDLGCGFNGSLINKVSRKINKGFGVDISVNENINNSKIKLIKHDLNKALPFEDCIFDVVVSLANLEHLNDPKKSINEIYRVLKDEGTLLLTSPSIYSKPVLEFLSYKLGLISEEEIHDHKNYFNKNILVDYCSQTGFSFVKHSYFQLFMNNFLIARK